MVRSTATDGCADSPKHITRMSSGPLTARAPGLTTVTPSVCATSPTIGGDSTNEPTSSADGSLLLPDGARRLATRYESVESAARSPGRNCTAASAMAFGASVDGSTDCVVAFVTRPPSALVANAETRSFRTAFVVPFCTITAIRPSTGALDATTATLPAGTGASAGSTLPAGGLEGTAAVATPAVPNVSTTAPTATTNARARTGIASGR